MPDVLGEAAGRPLAGNLYADLLHADAGVADPHIGFAEPPAQPVPHTVAGDD